MKQKKRHTVKAGATERNKKASRHPILHKLRNTWSKVGRRLPCLPYIISFLLLWFFSSVTYGDVFTRTVQESFVCSDAAAMKFLTDQEYGSLYVFGRYLLLMFHNPWLGGLLFSILLTAMAALFDRAFRVPLWLRGISTLVPLGLLAIFLSQGINIYYKSEPSLFVLISLAVFLIAVISGIALPFLLKRLGGNAPRPIEGWREIPFGILATLIGFCALQGYASTVSCENTILTARMQNRILRNDIPSLISDGYHAKQPTRSVAAYYAMGLVHTDQILEHLFDISFNFPKIHIHEDDNSGEYGIFQTDCNFYAGLVNASYRSAMDQTVMNGPRLYYLKRMAICAILNQEKALAEKYLTIIGKVPFESGFVAKYRPYADNFGLVENDPIFSRVLKLKPISHSFEQNYRSPTFMGYNVGMSGGNNIALAPSIAVCLYSKELPNAMQRAVQYKKMCPSMPLSLMEGLCIYAHDNPAVYNYFPELREDRTFPHAAVTNVNNFFMTIKQFYENKYNGNPEWIQKMEEELHNGINDELRAQLAPVWVGHYVYYYFCENVVMEEQAQKEHSGVN